MVVRPVPVNQNQMIALHRCAICFVKTGLNRMNMVAMFAVVNQNPIMCALMSCVQCIVSLASKQMKMAVKLVSAMSNQITAQ